MSNISKRDYIECMSRMMDKTNEELKKYPVGSFISRGPADEVVDYYRIKSVKPGVCVVRHSFVSSTIETLIPPSMIVEPIARVEQNYGIYGRKEWLNMKGNPSIDIIQFYEGGKKHGMDGTKWMMPHIEPFYKWRLPVWGKEIGEIERAGGSYTSIRTVDNVEIVEVLNNVKLSEERRKEENERNRQEQLEREKQSRSITKNMIDDLLKSL